MSVPFSALKSWPLCLALLVGAAQGQGSEEPVPLRFTLPSQAQGFDAAQYPALWRWRRLQEPVFGSRILVLEAGAREAPALLLVHGLGQAGWRDWLPQIEALAQHYRVVALDLPGFGHSEPGSGRYSPTQYARLLAWLNGELKLGRAQVVGHSMGGAVALRYAAGHAQDVARLVLIDAAGILERSSFLKTPTELPSQVSHTPRLLQKLAHQAKDFGDTLVEMSGLGPDPVAWLSASDAAWDRLLKNTPNLNAAIALMEEDFSAAVPALAVPTVLIWGEQDRVAPLRTGQALLATLPQAQLHTLPGVGHVPMQEQPEVLNRLLLQALQAPWPAPTPAAAFEASEAAADLHCRKQTGLSYRGRYRRVLIQGCTGIVLEDLQAQEIRIEDSLVTLQRVRVESQGTALHSKESVLRITASSFSGEVAVLSDDSRLDLAGVRLLARQASLQIERMSRVILSLSEVRSPYYSGFAHGLYRKKQRRLDEGLARP